MDNKRGVLAWYFYIGNTKPGTQPEAESFRQIKPMKLQQVSDS
jgi:hypothetical protein